MSYSFAPASQLTDHPSIVKVVGPDGSTAVVALDNTLSAIDIVTAIAKEADEILENVPIVKLIADVVLQIVKIRDVSMLTT